MELDDGGTTRAPGWRPVVTGSVETLNPGSFAFVMATGIVSSALAADGNRPTSTVLLGIATAGYLLLWVAYLWRLARWPRRFLSDLAGPHGFAFLTAVAASEVLAGRLTIGHRTGTAEVLAGVGAATWLLLGYGVPLLVMTARQSVQLHLVDGTWFIWAVGTESVAVACASLAPHVGGSALGAFASVCWAVGLVQYMLIAALVLARLLLKPLAADELIPPYWVFMGAAAITVLAGARLLELPSHQGLLPETFVAAVSMVLWSLATWLIPLLLVLGAWRHVVRGVSLRYETGLWAMVFPMGMYAVASRRLGQAEGHSWMATAGDAEAWVAAAVWALVFAAMLGSWARAVRRTV